MKKLITVVAVLFFALGLNANTLKEEIYNSNPAQFNQLEQELKNLHNVQVQTEKQQKGLMEQNLNKAIKAVFSNKEIVNNYKYAVVKNGQIIKLSATDDEDGILFWHEHSPNVQDAQQNVCKIYDPSWENITFDTPCGMLKYQMLANSPYVNNIDSVKVEFFPYDTELENSINNFNADEPIITPNFQYFHISVPDNPNKINFYNSQVVTDSIGFAGFIFNNSLYTGEVGFGKYFFQYNPTTVSNYYRPTEYNISNPYGQLPGDYNVVSLKSGNYIHMLVLSSPYEADPNLAYFIIKWFNLKVENYYLGDVGIQNNTLNRGAKIGFNNREITITLEDSINPTDNVYELYDIGGKLIEKRKLFSHETKISMPQVSNGIYVVRVQGKNLSASKKISFVK